VLRLRGGQWSSFWRSAHQVVQAVGSCVLLVFSLVPL
jgi:hypothetical protein